jgi:hypothetical protein
MERLKGLGFGILRFGIEGWKDGKIEGFGILGFCDLGLTDGKIDEF